MVPRIDPALVAYALPLVLALVATAAPGAQMPSQEELQRMMERHAEAAQPGPEHERIASLVGVWDVQITVWPEPGAEPFVMPPATLEAEMILGSRFLRQHLSGGEGAMFAESISLLGFDRRNGLYNLMALDTTGTYWVTAAGQAVSDDRIVLSGTDWDGIVGHEQQYDFVLTWEGPDVLVTEVVFKDEIHTRGGPPHKMVETRSTRRASAGPGR